MPPPAPSRQANGIGFVALVCSAGGLEALSYILHDLPADLPATVLVGQYLGGQGSSLAGILARGLQLAVQWIEDGRPLAPGRVYVCPPCQRVEVLPDGRCALAPDERGTAGDPLSFMLELLADSLGPRTLAPAPIGTTLRPPRSGGRLTRSWDGTQASC